VANNFINENPVSAEINRANEVRRDNDTFSTPSVTIYDVDYAILHFIKNDMKLNVMENGKSIPVPVMFANGEMWAQFQKHGHLRDKLNKSLTPMILLRRTSLIDDDRFPQLETGNRNSANTIIYRPIRQTSNQYERINKGINHDLPVDAKDPKSQTLMVTVLPRRVVVTYDIVIMTELTDQLNYIVQQLNRQTRRMWGDSMQFETHVKDFQFETSTQGSDSRIVRATTSLEVFAGLLNSFELQKSTVLKAQSIKRIDFRNEVNEYELYPNGLPDGVKFIDFSQNRNR
jgi:hypothetical protein